MRDKIIIILLVIMNICVIVVNAHYMDNKRQYEDSRNEWIRVMEERFKANYDRLTRNNGELFSLSVDELTTKRDESLQQKKTLEETYDKQYALYQTCSLDEYKEQLEKEIDDFYEENYQLLKYNEVDIYAQYDKSQMLEIETKNNIYEVVQLIAEQNFVTGIISGYFTSVGIDKNNENYDEMEAINSYLLNEMETSQKDVNKHLKKLNAMYATYSELVHNTEIIKAKTMNNEPINLNSLNEQADLCRGDLLQLYEVMQASRVVYEYILRGDDTNNRNYIEDYEDECDIILRILEEGNVSPAELLHQDNEAGKRADGIYQQFKDILINKTIDGKKYYFDQNGKLIMVGDYVYCGTIEITGKLNEKGSKFLYDAAYKAHMKNDDTDLKAFWVSESVYLQ